MVLAVKNSILFIFLICFASCSEAINQSDIPSTTTKQLASPPAGRGICLDLYSLMESNWQSTKRSIIFPHGILLLQFIE